MRVLSEHRPPFTNEWNSDSSDLTASANKWSASLNDLRDKTALSLNSLANAFLPPSSGAMAKRKEQSLVMSLSISWPLRVLVISAVRQQGMIAMRTQTPGCPVTGLYHPDDRREKLSARVFVSAALVSILAVPHCQCAGRCDDLGTF